MKSQKLRLAEPLFLIGVIAAALLVATCGIGRDVQAAAAQPAPTGLKAILTQMDASSKSFRTAEASVTREQYDRIVHDTTTETGSIYFQRNGAAIQMGAKFNPPATVLEYKNGTLRIYQSGQLKTYSASGADQARFQTYLTLGFGGSGTDLASTWDITDQGSEQIDAVKVEKLDLVSKDPGVRNTYTHITIWIDPARDLSLKQEFFAPGDNTNTVTYSNIRYNQPDQLKKDLPAFAIKCQGKCN
jgi:outer membrane lipoprotein-sorting protein